MPSKYATLEDKPPIGAEQDKNSEEEKKKTPWYVWLIRFLLLAAIVGVVLYFCISPERTKDMALRFLDWLSENRFLGPLVLFAVLTVTQAMLIPSIAFCLGSGFALMKAYKSAWLAITIASLTCNLGMWAGSIFGMLFARYMFRETAMKLAKKHKWMAALDLAMETDGFKFLIIMRICPLIPFAIQNYIMGATSMKMKHFAATGGFMLPWTVMIVFFGTTLSNLHDAVNGNFETGPIGLGVLVIGSIIALVASVLLSIVVKRHFDAMLKDAGEGIEDLKEDIENGNPQEEGVDLSNNT